MKTFKRPMFRRGGNVGIMSGMKDTRTNFQDGTTEQMIKDRAKLYRQYAGDPIANLLIQGGLGLVSGEGAGKGTLGSVATAFRKPTEQALAQEQQIGLKAVGDVLAQQQAFKLAAMKAKGTMQKERRIALANLNRRGIKNPTEDQILNEVSRVAMQTEDRFKTSLRESRLNKLLENPQIQTRIQATIADDFEQLIGSKIPASKVYPQYILRREKDGSISKKQLSKDGIYLDINVPGGRIIEIISGQSKDVTDQYKKK